MLRITEAQMDELERSRLATVKNGISRSLHARFPEEAASLGQAELAGFVRKAMESARAVWIDDARQMERFVTALFTLEYVMQDVEKLRYFSSVVMSEESAEARLLFVEQNLLADKGQQSVPGGGQPGARLARP